MKKIKVVSMVSDPPITLAPTDLTRIQQESERLHRAFTERTARMELLTGDDCKVSVK